MHTLPTGHAATVRRARLSEHRLLGCLGLFLGLAYTAASAVAGITSRASYDTISSTTNVVTTLKLHNGGATSATFTHKIGGTIATASGVFDATYNFRWPVAGTGGQPTYVKTAGISSDPFSYTVAAGATAIVPLRITLTVPAWAGSGLGAFWATFPQSYLCDVTVPYFEGATAKTATFAWNLSTSQAAGSAMLVTGTAPDLETFGGVGRACWGTVELNVPPPSGTITVTGAYLGLNGAGSVLIQVNDGVNVTWTTKATNTVTTGTAGAAMSNTVWTTASPSLFDGKKYRILMNGGTVRTGLISLTGVYSFAITEDIAFAQSETVGDLVLDEEGDPLPLGPDIDISNLWGEGHDRPAVIEVNVLGADPSGDTATATSVKDYYRATRAAVEDALKTGQPSFDFAGWERPARAATSEGGDNAGAFMSEMVAGGIAAAGASINLGSLPGGGTPGIPVHKFNGVLMGTIVWPSMVTQIRGIILILLTIYFFIAMINMLRSGFAGS